MTVLFGMGRQAACWMEAWDRVAVRAASHGTSEAGCCTPNAFLAACWCGCSVLLMPVPALAKPALMPWPACPPPADPSPRVRGMVEGLLLRCLAGRRLLAGNLVALPLFGQHAVFAVEHVALASSGTAPPAAAASEAAAGQAQSEPGSQAGVPAVPPPVTADTAVRLLAEGEAPPVAGQQPQERDWPAAAAAAAAEALGCGPEDAGAVAAARAVSVGLASRNITFDQLGGTDKQVGQAA